MSTEPYELRLPPKQAGSVVFASPHSGRKYPETFLRQTVLGEQAIRSSEDAFVDLLFADAPDLGAPLLQANAPRAYIDMNRGRDELDPALIAGTRRGVQNPRVASGLGVVPRVVAGGRAIYRGRIPLAEAERRIRSEWIPYHRTLEKLLRDTHATFGEAILLDCHSMPSEAIGSIGVKGGRYPDIVLGDRYGSAARQDIVDRIAAVFSDAGFRVVRNTPFAGAFTAERYGRPSRNQHVVQIEINRGLYMDEARIVPADGFDALRTRLRGVIAQLIRIGLGGRRLAAE